VENPQGVCRGVAGIDMDGQTLDASSAINLLDDGQTHRLRITLG